MSYFSLKKQIKISLSFKYECAMESKMVSSSVDRSFTIGSCIDQPIFSIVAYIEGSRYDCLSAQDSIVVQT